MERKGSVASTTAGVNEMDVAEVEKHFGVDTDSEPLKGAWSCKMSGGVGSHTGKLFLTSQRLCYFGKGMLSQSSKAWDFAELLDVDRNGSGKNVGIVIVTIGAKKYSFGGFENIDRTMNTIQRILYGSVGNTAIHQAVEQKDYDKVKALLEYDAAKLNQFNKAEQLPLHLAFSKNDAEMVRLLLDYYAKNRGACDINLPHEKTKNTSLHTACMLPNISDKILKDLISFEGIDVDVKNADDNTPLHYFCEKTASLECKKIGKQLIEKSKDPKQLVSQPNLNKETAMHKVMFNKQVRGLMVHLLMKYSADLNVKSKLGNTPLHYAIRYHREGLVRSLIKGGANTSILTSDGQSPLELAIEERKGIQPGSSAAEQESHASAVEIEQILTHIEDLQSLLKRVGLSDLAPKFIMEELYEPDVLAAVTEATLEKLGIQIKVGPQIKLMKEIESFKSRLAEQRAEEERRREEEKKRKPAVDDDAEDDTLVEDPNKIRSTLALEGSWEIRYDELEFTKKLGAGASGQVYKGICRGKEVAIKVLTNVSVEETMEEFKKELHIMTTVRSPYMVTFFGATIAPKLCMVMELCSKGSLYHVLNDRTFNWNWDLMFRAALDMSYGMDVLHSWDPPIVHRDLKSLNLLVTSDFRIKVCDFGLSRFTAGTNLETFKKLCGTFAYCAPEIFNGGTFTGKSDVFSMGMVLWELLIKLLKGKYEQPYSEFKNLTYDFQIIVQAASGLRPTLPDQTPASFKKLYQDCTSPQVESRPSAAQIVERLKEIRKEYRKDKAAWDALVVS